MHRPAQLQRGSLQKLGTLKQFLLEYADDEALFKSDSLEEKINSVMAKIAKKLTEKRLHILINDQAFSEVMKRISERIVFRLS